MANVSDKEKTTSSTGVDSSRADTAGSALKTILERFKAKEEAAAEKIYNSMSAETQCSIGISTTTWQGYQWNDLSQHRQDLNIGDSMVTSLSNGYLINFKVAAKILDQVVFVTENCYGFSQMYRSINKGGGWEESELRDRLNHEILNMLPAGLITLIKPWNTGKQEDLLWVPSKQEILGAIGLNPTFPLFLNLRERIKISSLGEIEPWWLRNQDEDKENFLCVREDGKLGSYNGIVANGVIFGFTI